MSLSYTAKKNDYEEFPPSDTIEILKILGEVPNSTVITKCLEERGISNKSKEELFKQVTFNKNELADTKKLIDDEYSVAPRVISRLPRNVIQHWVNTGHLPYQSYINNTEYSDTGSSLSEEECLYETHATTNTLNTFKLNTEQLCNNSPTNSSVDTAAYILSSMNVKRKENICSKLFMREVTQMHKDINYTNEKVVNAVNAYNTINSSISNKICISDICGNDKIYKKDELEETIMKENIIKKQNEMRLLTPHREDINEICKDNKIFNKSDLSTENEEELPEHKIGKSVNINNNDKQVSYFDSLQNDTISNLKQRKLYTGRDSPTDIVAAQFKKNNFNQQKRFLHPALQDSPRLQKRYKKAFKKRKHAILNTLISKRQDDSFSSDNNKSNDIDEEMHPAKRQKTVEDIENNVKTDSLIDIADKSYQSYNALLREQLRKFSAMEFADTKKYINLKTTRRMNKMTKKETEVKTDLCNTSYKNQIPVIVLERLSEEMIKYYTKRKDSQSEIQETKDIQIAHMTENTNEFDEFSLNSKDTVTLMKENVFVDSIDSDSSTIIIYNCQNAKSECKIQNALLLFHSNKSQSDKFLSDEKLTVKKPMVVLERLCSTKLGSKCSTKPISKTFPMVLRKKKEFRSLHVFQNKLEPVVVLERLVLDAFVNSREKSSHKRNSLTRNGFNKTNANKKEIHKEKKMQKENGMINNKANNDYKNNKRLMCFQTSPNDSDSDSDVSFNSFTIVKPNTTNETINRRSSNSLKTNTSKDSISIKDNKRVSLRNISKQKLNSSHTSGNDSSAHSLTNNKSNILKNNSSRDKVNHLSNSINNKIDNQQACTVASILFNNDTSKNEDICKNNKKNNVINKDMKDKAKRFTLCTKAYDSDTD